MPTLSDSRMPVALAIERRMPEARQRDRQGEPTIQSKKAYQWVCLNMEDEMLTYMRYQVILPLDVVKLLVRDLFDDAWRHLDEQPADRLFYYWMFEKASLRMQSRSRYRWPHDSPYSQARRKFFLLKLLLYRRSRGYSALSDQANLALYLLHLLPLRQCQCLILYDKLGWSVGDIAQIFRSNASAVHRIITLARCRFILLHAQR
jgi:hypothetical protein